MGIKLKELRRYSPGQLAYLGDSVYELYIRSYLLSEGFLTPGELNKKALHFVSAPKQAFALEGIEELLDEEELDFVRRGRNVKTGSIPKKASYMEYRQATGLECLLGALYVENKRERISELMEACVKILEHQDEME